MNEKQILLAIVGGILSAIVGGLLIIPVELIYEATGHHVDGGDDGWGLLWYVLMILSGILGFFLSARWAHRRHTATSV